MIVVDTNMVAYLYLDADQSALAEAVLLADPDWAAPLLWRSEFSNILASYMRRQMLTLPDALAIMDAAQGRLAGREHQVATADVLALAQASGCSAYDCEFVALARELGVSLVTFDRQVLRAYPGLALSAEAFCG